jgi:hypothetical protein
VPDEPVAAKHWIESLSQWAESQNEQEKARNSELEWSSKEIARWYQDHDDSKFPLGKIPLIVLSAGAVTYSDTSNVSATELLDERRALQKRLAALSKNSKHIIDPTAGHNIHLDDPKSVVEAIRSLVDARDQGSIK